MNVYYSFIAGLPDLEFNPELDFLHSDKFVAMLEELLPPDEMAMVRLLWLQKFHGDIAAFLIRKDRTGEIAPGISDDALHSGSDSFGQLPCYLQKLVTWKETVRGDWSEMQIMQKMQQYYFAELISSENLFLKKWGEWELNLLNYRAARRCENDSVEKKQQLIKGNEYHDLLLEFTINQKIIHSEFAAVERLDAIAAKSNYLEREQETDRLRWETIDEINRFEYFTVNVILGYFAKLFLLERWKHILNPKTPVDAVGIAEQMMLEK